MSVTMASSGARTTTWRSWAAAPAHYMSGYTQIAGIMLPTGHRILPRTPEGQALTEPLLISIELSEITFA